MLLTAAQQSNAKVNILLGVCHTAGIAELKNIFEGQQKLLNLLINLTGSGMPFQIEHEFGNNLIWGLSSNIITAVIFVPFAFSIGPFFGGQIYKTQNYRCDMKGTVYCTVGLLVDREGNKSWLRRRPFGISPAIEFSWKKERASIVHALEVGCVIWITKIDTTMEFEILGKQIMPQIKYKAMWKLN